MPAFLVRRSVALLFTLLLNIIIINRNNVIQATTLEPLSESSGKLSDMVTESFPPTGGGDSGEDGGYYDDDPAVTFITDEDVYEDFGSFSRAHGHYQGNAGMRSRHDDERCPPPPQQLPALSSDARTTRLCRRRKCTRDSECSSDGSTICCYNGCIHSCQPKVDPPLAFDWLEETELKGLRNNNNESEATTVATSLSPKSSFMGAHVTPETIALPGGCFLNAQQYEHLKLFRKFQHVHSCTCSHGDVVCHVNADKDRGETDDENQSTTAASSP